MNSTGPEVTKKKSKRINPWQLRKNLEPGRNQLCPCGSNKKYKHCCLAKQQKQIEKQLEIGRSWDEFYKESKKEEGDKEALQGSIAKSQSSKRTNNEEI